MGTYLITAFAQETLLCLHLLLQTHARLALRPPAHHAAGSAGCAADTARARRAGRQRLRWRHQEALERAVEASEGAREDR